MPRPNSNAIIAQYSSAEQLVAAPVREVERILLRYIVEYCADGMHPMVTRDAISNGLFDTNGYPYSIQARTDVQRVIGRAWKGLDDAEFIEEPDPDNGKNGYRVPSAMGKIAHAGADYEGARMRSKFTREMFHPALPDAAWNAFTVGDYDTAVFAAFKSLEVAVRTKGGFATTDFGAALMKKAFDPDTGLLRDKAAPRLRQKARCELFTGAFGEIRNPKGHNDPTITDALVAAEEMMAAGVLRRIVDSA
jgi:uncharacterized protein (TIGR02391 family)